MRRVRIDRQENALDFCIKYPFDCIEKELSKFKDISEYPIFSRFSETIYGWLDNKLMGYLGMFRDEVLQISSNILDVEITGRSGGWLTVYFDDLDKAEELSDAINQLIIKYEKVYAQEYLYLIRFLDARSKLQFNSHSVYFDLLEHMAIQRKNIDDRTIGLSSIVDYSETWSNEVRSELMLMACSDKHYTKEQLESFNYINREIWF